MRTGDLEEAGAVETRHAGSEELKGAGVEGPRAEGAKEASAEAAEEPTPAGDETREMEDQGAAGSGDAWTCAICFHDDLPAAEKTSLPCCGKEGSSIQYCKTCMRILLTTTFYPGMGKCPTCSKWLSLTPDHNIEIAQGTYGRCAMCCQPKQIVDRALNLCELCGLGRRFCFRYQCQRCGRAQRIPHPMWMYQPSATEYTNNTWACHQVCGDYTNWRILPAGCCATCSKPKPKLLTATSKPHFVHHILEP